MRTLLSLRFLPLALGLFLAPLGCSSEASGTSSAGGDTAAGTDGSDGTDGGDGSDGTLGACPPAAGTCSPFCATTGCSDGQICTLSAKSYVCADAGPQAVGKPCGEGVPGCAEGACIQTASSGSRCLGFCREDTDCADGQTCNVVVPVGSDEVRFCGDKPPACDLFAQDCTGEGQACYLGESESICLKAGTAQVGEACKGGNDCAGSMLCIDDKCLEICNPNTNGPQPRCSAKCPGRDAGIEGVKGVAVCTLEDTTPPCDLLKQDCDGGKACYITMDGPRCRDAGTAQVGDNCGSDQDCVPGASCVGARCKALCNPDSATHDECKDSLTKCPKLSGQSLGYCDE